MAEEREVQVIGAGPAGSAAALSVLAAGHPVRLFDRSHFPRHRVCGEFLSPGIDEVLDKFGLWDDFERLGPARLGRFRLHLGNRTRTANLPEHAYGLSRYAFDSLLFENAIRRGAGFVREAAAPADGGAACVLAAGRKATAPRGNRLFGFKAHFRGPADDAVSLFFFHGGYAGVSCVEGGMTNVCGIAAESDLRSHGFEPDELLGASPALAERVRPLSRAMRWHIVGPLVFGGLDETRTRSNVYQAGDALGFADPFTGTGVLNAVSTGRLAGLAAATGRPPEQYLADCRRGLARLFRVSAFVRDVIAGGWAEFLLPLVPGSWLFRWTRPILF